MRTVGGVEIARLVILFFVDTFFSRLIFVLLIQIVAQERRNLNVVLEHICEVDSRKLFLKKGRNSLYEYLTKDLGYSSSAAQRRIEGARLLKEIPQMSEQIESGKINLYPASVGWRES